MDLLARIAELLGIPTEEIEAMSAEDIDGRLQAAGAEIDLTNPTDDDLERLSALTEAAEQVRELHAWEEAVRDERRAQADEIASRLRGEEESGDGEAAAEGEGAEEETPAAEPGEGPGAGEPGERETPQPETAPTSAPPQSQPASTDAPPSTTTQERQPEPVAAAAPPARRRMPPIARRAPVAREVPAANVPGFSGRLGRGPVSITAAADVPTRPAGSEFANMGEVASAMLQRWGTLINARGITEDVPVATIAANYPDNRVIDTEDPRETERIFEREAGLEAITAAGGFCAPVTPLYDLVSVSVADRPVKDGLPTFQAVRGGVTYTPPPKLSDLSGAVSTWTETDDIAGSSTKPCLTVTCTNAVTKKTDALPACLQFGNFQARAYPEQVERYQQLALAFQARYAERKALTTIGAGSTNISTGQTLGAARDFFAEAQRVDAAYRQSIRMDPQVPLRCIVPFHLRQRMRADLIRELPGDNSIAMSDEIIDAAFEDLGWNMTWALDGETGQEFGAQVAGGALPWPTTVVWYLFHEGAWVMLDSGTLDLGLVRDSTLNAKNNFQIFSETWELPILRGVQSFRVSSTLCESGQSAATVSTTGLCTTGS